MDDIRALFLIGLMGALAPPLARLPALVRTPVVMLDLVLGILIGPGGANLVSSQGAIGFLGELGLIYLFFQAGLGFKPAKIGLASLPRCSFSWDCCARLCSSVSSCPQQPSAC